MEQYYYNHMDKQKQAAYHGILQGITSLADEFQIPALDGEDLYNVFFQLRLDHPEIFWATGYKYKYYNDSPNLIFVPEYLFEKAKTIYRFDAIDSIKKAPFKCIEEKLYMEEKHHKLVNQNKKCVVINKTIYIRENGNLERAY